MSSTANTNGVYGDVTYEVCNVFGEPNKNSLFGNCDVSDLCEETFDTEHNRARQRWNFDVMTDKPIAKTSYRTLDWYAMEDDDASLDNSYFCGSSMRSSALRTSVSSSTSSTTTSLYEDSCFDDQETKENDLNKSDSNS